MTALELTLFGGFEARLKSGPPFEFPTRKTKLLLSYLALPPGQAHPRRKLASLLWSDRADEQAQHSLRQALSALRKALDEARPQPLLTDRQAVSLDPDTVTADVLRFEALLAEGTIRALRQACALYRGELLAGESARESPFEEWLFYERGRYHDLALGAFERLLTLQRAAGEADDAIETAQRLLALNRAHEKTHRALMRLFADLGRRTEALEQYRRCRAALDRELSVTPDPETEELYRDILQRRPVPSGAGLSQSPEPREPQRSTPDPLDAEPPVRDTPTLARRPSVAVLPLINLSDDPGQDYFCDGITEDIITDLSRFRSLFVIARHSSFAFRGHANDLRQVGRALGVQHIVEGSVQRAGKRVRVTVQLIDVENGSHLWAERYDRELEDIFAVQDDVTSQIASHVTKRIDDQRLEIARRRHPESLQAYDYWLQAKQQFELRSLSGLAEGRRLLEQSLELDPHFARAYAQLSRSYLFGIHYMAGGVGVQDKIDEALRTARKAVSLDDGDSWIQACMGWAYMFRRDFQPVHSHFELATSLNPCDADALMLRSQGQAYIGDAAMGLELANRAIQLNPFYPESYRLFLACIHFLARRYEEAFEISHRLPEMLPDTAAWKAIIAAQVNRMDEARSEAGRFMQNVRTHWVGEAPPEPGSYMRFFLDINPLQRDEDIAPLIENLRKAGLPE